MRLKEKLRRISAPAERKDPAAWAGGVALPGERLDGEAGRFWCRRLEFPFSHRHGERTLADVFAALPARLAAVARDPRLETADFSRAVFFDTETTSLGGGVSTYVFLLGAGFCTADAFVVEQYFLSDITEERALLHAVNKRFSEFDLVVSFHGKGFDTPRLKDRNSFHRMRLALPDVHLDLCLVGRSLFRGAFPDCRLQTFERELVGFRRKDDLPGAECPRAFFSHMQGDSRLIPRVFEHNLYDVLTLPAVAAHFAEAAHEPTHPVVLANLGGFFESIGRNRVARGHYLSALEGLRGDRHPLLGRALERLALLERRAGRHFESAQLLLERKGVAPHAFQPLEDLAKYYEHRARDLPEAQKTALDAKSQLLTGRIVLDRPARQRHLASLDHRLDRLQRRLQS